MNEKLIKLLMSDYGFKTFNLLKNLDDWKFDCDIFDCCKRPYRLHHTSKSIAIWVANGLFFLNLNDINCFNLFDKFIIWIIIRRLVNNKEKQILQIKKDIFRQGILDAFK